VKFRAASDQATLVYLGEEIGLTAHARVLKLLRHLQNQPIPWLRNLQPAYCSLLVTFDPCLVDHAQVEATLRAFEKSVESTPWPRPRIIEIPVCYCDEFGPDLKDVAKLHNTNPSKIIQIHSSRTYHAYFLGFAPGFAYLVDLSEKLATPRLESPRKKVPAGSVGIAGRQSAVYPFATPGGWRLIGQTPIAMFRPDRTPMETIAIGDKVRFHAISREEFRKLESA